jgi:hypothetical protein
MHLDELVRAVYERVDADSAVADAAAIARHDRYQASAGIADAAAELAELAESAGLAEVTLHRFPADGAQRWWTFRAPLGWTPLLARLHLNGETLLSYPEQPYTLAAYSAATSPGGSAVPVLRWSDVADGADPGGALVLLDTGMVHLPAALRRLSGVATAIAVDVLARRADRAADQVGRLELPPGCALAGLSLTAAQAQRLAGAAQAGAVAHLEVVAVPSPATMPVVSALIPGSEAAPQLLLTAHLCHPRPSANDNASGVAAILAAARVLARPGPASPARTGRSSSAIPAVRLVWGPEFVGIAAYLHDVVGSGRLADGQPALALNVDMAGEDPHRCGGPLIVERCPDELPSFLPALVQRCADLLPPIGRSYSGAVVSQPWSWRATPYAGGSDHAILADQPIRCPTVCLGHWPDRSNHPSADTLDLIDAAELRRTATIVAATVAALRCRADTELIADVADATAAWALDHVIAGLPGRLPPAAPAPRDHDLAADLGPVLDPNAATSTPARLRHRREVALATVRSLPVAAVPGPAARAAASWIEAATEMIIKSTPAGTVAPAELAKPAGLADQHPLMRGWPGPANLRALLASAPPRQRDWLEDRLAADRGGTYARALGLLRGLDGRRDRLAVAWWAALATELPMPVEFADRFLDLAQQAGWVSVAPRSETGG